MREVKLVGTWGSPFSRRVEMALQMKGVEYEYVEEDVRCKSPSPELVKYNPVHGNIPVLVVDGGDPIVESQVIIEFIDETWMGGHQYAILPKHPHKRALARFWARFIDDKSQVIIEFIDETWMDGHQYDILPKHSHKRALARFWARFIDDKCLPLVFKAFWGPEEEQESAEEEAKGSLRTLEDELRRQGTRFFGGDRIGFVDIVANFIGYWLDSIQEAAGKRLLTPEEFPELCRWKQDYVSCSIIKDNLPPRDRLVAFYTIRIEAAKASFVSSVSSN